MIVINRDIKTKCQISTTHLQSFELVATGILRGTAANMF